MADPVRTYDMAAIRRRSGAAARPELVLAGDVGRRDFRHRQCAFLSEDPWQRLRLLRERVPNICFQMLLRAQMPSVTRAIPRMSSPDL
jgi:pyruvate carboxylase